MRVDVDGAVRIARLAAGFDWTWTRADVTRFCAVADWQPESDGTGGLIRTDLAVERPEAFVLFGADIYELAQRNEEVTDIAVYVSDVEPEALSDDVKARAISKVVEQIVAQLGDPGYSDDPSDRWPRWVLPRVVIDLAVDRSITLRLTNPTYQAWIDAPEDDDEDDDYDI